MGGTCPRRHAPAEDRGSVRRGGCLGVRRRRQRPDRRHQPYGSGEVAASRMIRGAVYPVDLGDAKRGHEQRGRRFGLAISIEQNAWSTVTIIPTSTSAQASIFRPRVLIAGRHTKILIDKIRTVDISYVTGELVDYLSQDDMAQVEHSLSRYFGLLR